MYVYMYIYMYVYMYVFNINNYYNKVWDYIILGYMDSDKGN